MEMDPILVRSTRLLHSKTKESTDQLRALLEDVIKQRYGDSKSLAHLNVITKEYTPKKEPSSKTSSTSSSGRKDDSDYKRHEKMEVIEISPSKPTEPLKSKLSTNRMRDIEGIIIRDDIDDDDDDDDDDNDDLALEILEDDLSCIVCRKMAVGKFNHLVECLECHSLYHQECHVPPVAKADTNDPRWAWYCAACTQAINKQPSKSSSQSLQKTSSTSSSHSSSKSQQKAPPDPVQGLFKRQELKGSSGSKSSHQSSSSSTGMAGLAASFQPGASAVQSSSSSKSSSSKVSAPKVVTNVISADKRLANMKKKAAKQQETKRKHIK